MTRHGFAGWAVGAVAAVLLVVPAMAEPRPAVVELFTSQGCSSCPPADALLGELARRGDVIALAFHVQYWDSLGWRDRFGLAQATARQRAYARALDLPNVYTPQMVIDGTTDVVGSERPSVLAAIAGRREGIAIVARTGNGALSVDVGEGATDAAAEVTLVAFAKAAETGISRGENAGRALKEYDIVRAVRPLGAWTGRRAAFTVALDTLPADATAAAILLQRPGPGRVLGAVMVALR